MSVTTCEGSQVCAPDPGAVVTGLPWWRFAWRFLSVLASGLFSFEMRVWVVIASELLQSLESMKWLSESSMTCDEVHQRLFSLPSLTWNRSVGTLSILHNNEEERWELVSDSLCYRNPNLLTILRNYAFLSSSFTPSVGCGLVVNEIIPNTV